MEIRAVIKKSHVIGRTCDACGKECYKETGDQKTISTECAFFSASWGYWSDNKDGTSWDCDLCESCAEKVKNFIEQDLKGKVRVTEL